MFVHTIIGLFLDDEILDNLCNEATCGLEQVHVILPTLSQFDLNTVRLLTATSPDVVLAATNAKDTLAWGYYLPPITTYQIIMMISANISGYVHCAYYIDNQCQIAYYSREAINRLMIYEEVSI